MNLRNYKRIDKEYHVKMILLLANSQNKPIYIGE